MVICAPGIATDLEESVWTKYSHTYGLKSSQLTSGIVHVLFQDYVFAWGFSVVAITEVLNEAKL